MCFLSGFAPRLINYRYPGYDPYPYEQATNPSCGWRDPGITKTAFITPDKYRDEDIICHVGATHGSEYVEIAAGDVLTFQWTPWPVSHHGPVITYIAPCLNGDCLTVDKADLEFVKVDEVGQTVTGKANDDSGTWGADLLIKNDSKYEFRVPACTKPGPYVVRHEIIALMGASHPNGAQHYPNCVNIMVTGSGTEPFDGGVKGTDLYNADDPGLKLMIYGPINYVIPGPALHTCNAGSGSNTPSPSPNDEPSSSPNDTPSSSPTATSSTIATPKATTASVKYPYVTPSGVAQGSGTIPAHSVYSTGSAVYQYNSKPTPSVKSYGDQTDGNKVYADNNSGDENTYNDKPVDNKETYGDKNTYNDKSVEDKKTYGDKSTYNDKSVDDKKTYGGNPHDDKTQGDQSYNYGDKSDNKPYGSHPNQNTDSYTSPKSHIATGSTDKGSSTFDIPADATLEQLIAWLKEILALLKSKFGVNYRRHARDVAV